MRALRRSLPAALLGVLVLAASGADAHAQSLGFARASDAPIEIEADDGIEWQRTNQLYIARGNARAVQGTTSVAAETLTAFYRITPEGGTEIYRIDAEGGVRIASDREVATGDKAVYDVVNGVLVLTGERVRLDTPQDRIVANDSLEYYERRRLAIARGDAIAFRPDGRVRADVLMAHFSEAPDGSRDSRLQRIEAVGDVVITTAGDIARADQGDYDLRAGLATLSGRVRLTRGDTQINGEFGEVDLNTGVSRLVGDPSAPATAEPGRVKALIVPAGRSRDEAPR